MLNDIYLPEEVRDKIITSLDSDRARVESERENHKDRTQQRLASLRTRMDQMYEDKLDGKIDDVLVSEDERMAGERAHVGIREKLGIEPRRVPLS